MGNLFEDKITPLSEAEAAYYLNEAWKKLYDEYPSVDSLALLWAQSALESGRWKSLHNFNWGNIKRSDDEDYCMYRCNEKLNGQWVWFDPPHKQTWFRAYSSTIDGACDYVRFLSQRKRYQKAWAAIQKGDPYAFGHELKVAGYYTADEAGYTKSVVSLTREFKRKADEILSWSPTQNDIPTVRPKPITSPIPPSESTAMLTNPEIPRPPPLPQIDENVTEVKKTFIQRLLEKLNFKLW